MPKPQIIKPRAIGISSVRMGPFFTVASVELGNTTTKCILVTTNLKTAEIFEIGKEVRMTRDVRPSKPDERVFGKTLVGVELTQESVSEFIADIITSTLSQSHVDIKKDLHFVVRSTGVTAGFAHPSEIDAMVKALADGCLKAGIPPKKMTAALSPENLPPGIQDYTWLKKVYFDGAVASSIPPANTEVVANEMEGELVTAGLKGAVKGTRIDFRNPAITLDFGTTLAGRITDDGFPYANTIGSFAGIAGAIPDAIARGTGLVDTATGCIMDIKIPTGVRSTRFNHDLVEDANKLITVEPVKKGETRVGGVPVDTKAAEESNVILIGVDAGKNGSKLPELGKVGNAVYEEDGIPSLLNLIDAIQASIVQRIIDVVEVEGLIRKESSLGLTGRAITSGSKPALINSNLRLSNGSYWTADHQLVFVEDGLAMGAAVAARCMNSLGTTRNPMGGRKGDGCIMNERIKLQKNHR
ncbi:MAG: methanogenesis marker 14 protein [Candidatus Thorarchaeota archaeon]